MRHRQINQAPFYAAGHAALILGLCTVAACTSHRREWEGPMVHILAMMSCTAADRELFEHLRAECPPDSTFTCKSVQVYPALRRRGGLPALFRSQKFRESFYLPHDARSLPGFRMS